MDFQISKIIECRLKRIGDLSYEFYQGAGGTYFFPKKESYCALVVPIITNAKGDFWYKLYRIIPSCINYRYKMWLSKIILFHQIVFSYDGFAFRNHADSKNGHFYTALANIEGYPLALGGYTGSFYIKNAETYDISTNAWIEVADYPYHDS